MEGTPLPPVRQLTADLGVNLNTIATAYRELQKDGLIVVNHGSGSVVAARMPIARTPAELGTPLRTGEANDSFATTALHGDLLSAVLGEQDSWGGAAGQAAASAW